MQEIPVGAGSYAAVVSYYAPAESKTAGTVQIIANLRSATGQVLEVQRSEARPVAETAGQWSGLALALDVPEQINGTAVHHIQLVIVVDGFSGDEAVYLDDVFVYPFESSSER